MERHEVLDLMKALRLSGMRAAFDENRGPSHHAPTSDTARHRRAAQAEIADKKARSIKYQMTIAKLPMAKALADFDFSASSVNEPRVRDLATGAFLEGKRNLVLVGGTGSGKTHLSVAIARA